jgi:hypothetical protein
MSKLFAVIGIALILLGAALFVIPISQPKTEALRRSAPAPVGIVAQLRSLAEQANAPLSILFGFLSLYYSRKRYLAERNRTGGGQTG